MIHPVRLNLARFLHVLFCIAKKLSYQRGNDETATASVNRPDRRRERRDGGLLGRSERLERGRG